MKFRTEIEITPCAAKIGYENRLLAIGSCFAEHIATRLVQAKFRIAANPTGILFNPLSIAAAIYDFALSRVVSPDELRQDGDLWFHYGFHGTFSAATQTEALERMNAARQAASEALRTADRVLITFGTAWVYEHDGCVVANCHKQPAGQFVRRLLAVAEIVDAYDQLLAGPLAGRDVVLTISPVRHLGDGLEGNAISKATLRLAAGELTEKHPNVHYFPAYEIVMDDLRDYRFYADDMLHPSSQAVAYVWEKFTGAVLSDQARGILPEVEKIVSAAAHRPLHPESSAFMAFCHHQRDSIARLPQIDFSAEEAYFQRCIEINL